MLILDIARVAEPRKALQYPLTRVAVCDSPSFLPLPGSEREGSRVRANSASRLRPARRQLLITSRSFGSGLSPAALTPFARSPRKYRPHPPLSL